MIFSKEHLALIAAGRKTQTRRLGKRRWKQGAVHPAKVGWYDKPEMWIRILNVHSERLGSITLADARAEGYSSIEAYRAAWQQIYRKPWDDALEIWVVDFRLHNGPEHHQQVTLFDEEATTDG